MTTYDEEKQQQRLDELKRKEEENLTKILSEKYDLPYIDLSATPIDIDALRVVHEKEARDAQVAPFQQTDKNIHIGILSPSNEKTKEVLKKIEEQGFIPYPFMVSHQSLNRVWERYKDLSFSMETKGGALDISSDEIGQFISSIKGPDDIKTEIDKIISQKNVYRTSKVLEIILGGALATKASDVHIEPEEEYVRLRYRLDGVLTEITRFDNKTYALLNSRVKLISGLKLNVKDKAQDGRFSIKVGDGDIEIRTSLLPGAYGESIVLRVLNPNAISVPLEDLGIHPRLLAILLREIEKPNGMLLNTGPTGSGKTTTLYAFLKKVHDPGIKIITIENPIEYHLPGIVQTQTDSKKGYTFEAGLRSALRQDPDIIMVGEIRDNETAEIAVNAALTGHLVFSTLHTNDAAGTFPRLIDLGINPKIISSALTVAMAQRLVRKLCKYCKNEVILEGRDKEMIEKIVSGIHDKTYLDGIETKTYFKAVGCPECNGKGYKGRLGVYEAILSDPAVEKIVTGNPSAREINAAARPQNILNMKEDGVIKILQGITSLEELERIIDLEQES